MKLVLLPAAAFVLSPSGTSSVVDAAVVCGSGSIGTTYNVGAGHPYTTIGSVRLDTLQPGDHVCIYPGTYREKFVVNRSGTAASPIVFRGVPDASGNLPVIDGDGAVTPTYLDYWGENRNLVKIGGASYPVPADGAAAPSYIRVQGLKLQNARQESGITYTSDNGATGQSYAKNAACLMIERGYNIEFVGNEISGCGNGVFISPGNSGDVLIERNYIHGNGHDGSIYEHNVYTETLGIAYRFNRFGPLCSTCGGNNLKDRSAGLEVSYNFIEGGNRQLDIVDSSNYNAEPNYANSYVYGNILVETDGSGNRQMIHYGGDGGDPTKYRNGVLHFYHNTLLSTRSGKTTLVRLSSDQTTMDARNNIVYVTDVAAGSNLELLAEKRGTLLLTNNWLRPGYFYWVSASHGGSVTEVGTVTETDTGPIFEDADFATAPYDLHLLASLVPGAALDAGAPPVTSEYVMHLASGARSSADLGAFGFAGVGTPAPTPSPIRAPTKEPSEPTDEPTHMPTKAPTNEPTGAPTRNLHPVTKYLCSKREKSPAEICANGVAECTPATCSNGGKQCWQATCLPGACDPNGSACSASSECCSGHCGLLGGVCEDEPSTPPPAPQCAGGGESCQFVSCCVGLSCPGGKPSERKCS